MKVKIVGYSLTYTISLGSERDEATVYEVNFL